MAFPGGFGGPGGPPASRAPQRDPFMQPRSDFPVQRGPPDLGDVFQGERRGERPDVGEFHGDKMPASSGGSMLFGPGNPQFDRGEKPMHRGDPRIGLPKGVPPGARFDPLGPFGTGSGEPDPDHEPRPGRKKDDVM